MRGPLKLSRRKFIESCSALGLALAAGPDLLAREPHLDFPTRPADRIALTSWPFRDYMIASDNRNRDKSKPGIDMKDFGKMAIEKFNIHNINPVISHFRSTDRKYLDEVRESTAKAGSKFVGLGLGHGKFYDPDASVRKAAVAEAKKGIDIAKVLGSPSVRQHIEGSKGTKPNVDRAAPSLNELADYGAKQNIVINLENDNPVAEDPFFIVKIIEKARNPYLRALPDMGNSLQRGDHAFNVRAVTAMFHHAFNMSHVKDESGDQAGHVYHVDLAKLFHIAKQLGYKGYFSMEWEGKGDPFAGTRELMKKSLRYLS